MKRIIIYLLCFMLFMATSITVYAEDGENNNQSDGVLITVVVPTPEPTPEPIPAVPILYPVSASETREHGRREVIRVYELADHENPDHIPREPFEREGFQFYLAEIVKSEMLSFDSREHVETITVNTGTNDLETVLRLLSQTLEYQSEDGFVGLLTLDVSTIRIESAGTKTNTSTASRTREYPNLSSNDLSLIPKTITDGGTTFHLADVDWRVGNTEAIDYTQLPQFYTAVATYSATVSRTSVVGYNTTAEYKGVISRTAQGRMRYTATFIGVPIVTPAIMEPSETLSATETDSADVTAQEVEEINDTPETQNEQDVPAEETETILDVMQEETETILSDDAASKGGDELNTEKQFVGISPTCLFILLAAVASIAYFAGKLGKKIFSMAKKPLCLMIIAAMVFSMPQMAFASSLSQLPDYGFGGGSAGNTVYFDTIPTNAQHDYANISQNSQMSAVSIPQAYNDGELIGKLTVKKLGRTINIYEGESLASMNKGGGRFSFTGMNSGNTAIIGHNRGRTNGYFIFVKDLREGDILTLEMGGVTKNYAVTQLYTVTDTDFSPLMQFSDSRLTLVTCLENQKNIRRILVAMEV